MKNEQQKNQRKGGTPTGETCFFSSSFINTKYFFVCVRNKIYRYKKKKRNNSCVLMTPLIGADE